MYGARYGSFFRICEDKCIQIVVFSSDCRSLCRQPFLFINIYLLTCLAVFSRKEKSKLHFSHPIYVEFQFSSPLYLSPWNVYPKMAKGREGSLKDLAEYDITHWYFLGETYLRSLGFWVYFEEPLVPVAAGPGDVAGSNKISRWCRRSLSSDESLPLLPIFVRVVRSTSFWVLFLVEEGKVFGCACLFFLFLNHFPPRPLKSHYWIRCDRSFWLIV